MDCRTIPPNELHPHHLCRASSCMRQRSDLRSPTDIFRRSAIRVLLALHGPGCDSIATIARGVKLQGRYQENDHDGHALHRILRR